MQKADSEEAGSDQDKEAKEKGEDDSDHDEEDHPKKTTKHLDLDDDDQGGLMGKSIHSRRLKITNQQLVPQ